MNTGFKMKQINRQVFIEFFSFLVFSGVVIWFLASGKYLSYVTPKMLPYLIFTLAVMVIWMAASFKRLVRPQYKVRAMHCLILLIPSLLMVALPRTTVGSADLSGSYATADMMGGISQSITNKGTLGELSDQKQAGKLSGLDKEKKTITISNEDFAMWMTEINRGMKEYEGYTVQMTGFVFTDSEFLADNEFVPARLMMSCCIADLVPAGMRCTYEKVGELEAESWVTVEGTLEIRHGDNYDEPIIAVTNIIPAEPVEDYIYAYY